MTLQLIEGRPVVSSRRLDPLSAYLQLVRDLTGREALLESCDGEVVAHALDAQPGGAVCAAVLSRTAQPLRVALRDRRTVALTAAGGVLIGHVDGQTVTVVPVPCGDGPARLWLLGPAETDLDGPLRTMLEELGGLATRLSQVEAFDVAEVVRGAQALSRGLTGCSSFLLVAEGPALPGVAGEKLRQASRGAAARIAMHVGVLEGTDVAVVSSHVRLGAEALASMLTDWAAPDGTRCVLAPWEHDHPYAAFSTARTALRVAPPGCSLPSQLRSRVFVRLMREAALAVPGDDPVAHLVADHPALAGTLLAWLNTHGDVLAAAAALHCHPNTLRYRLKRAGELLPGDLGDPSFRLEIHLRLMCTTGTRDSSARLRTGEADE